jgi:hypothetical protein
LKESGKILSEEHVSTEIGGRTVEGLHRILAGPKGNFRQEVVYRGCSVGDPALYPPEDKGQMLSEAKRLLFELVSQRANT